MAGRPNVIMMNARPPFIIGPQGPQGPRGIAGIQGPQGPCCGGSQGPQGASGSQGPQGVAGLQGPQGIEGNTGTQGPQGDVGPQGDIGPQGEQGIQGNSGPQGLQGNTGTQGAQGSIGSQGVQGPQGAQGQSIIGPQGGLGPVGPQGAQGPSSGSNVQSRSVSTILTYILSGLPTTTYQTLADVNLLYLADTNTYRIKIVSNVSFPPPSGNTPGTRSGILRFEESIQTIITKAGLPAPTISTYGSTSTFYQKLTPNATNDGSSNRAYGRAGPSPGENIGFSYTQIEGINTITIFYDLDISLTASPFLVAINLLIYIGNSLAIGTNLENFPNQPPQGLAVFINGAYQPISYNSADGSIVIPGTPATIGGQTGFLYANGQVIQFTAPS